MQPIQALHLNFVFRLATGHGIVTTRLNFRVRVPAFSCMLRGQQKLLLSSHSSFAHESCCDFRFPPGIVVRPSVTDPLTKTGRTYGTCAGLLPRIVCSLTLRRLCRHGGINLSLRQIDKSDTRDARYWLDARHAAVEQDYWHQCCLPGFSGHLASCTEQLVTPQERFWSTHLLARWSFVCWIQSASVLQSCLHLYFPLSPTSL